MKIERFEDIEAWQSARELVRAVYACSRISPMSKDFALRDQMRRAAVSVMSNIAEGFEHGSRAEFIQFLSIAKGSAGEVEAQLYVALDQGYISEDDFERMSSVAVVTKKRIAGLINYLKKSPIRGQRYQE